MVLLNLLPTFLHWGYCGMLGPFPLYPGTLFSQNAVCSGSNIHYYVCIVLIDFIFCLTVIYSCSHYFFLLSNIFEALSWIAFVFSHHLVQQVYAKLWENNVIMHLIAPTKASIAKSKNAASLSVPGKISTPGNRHGRKLESVGFCT